MLLFRPQNALCLEDYIITFHSLSSNEILTLLLIFNERDFSFIKITTGISVISEPEFRCGFNSRSQTQKLVQEKIGRFYCIDEIVVKRLNGYR